MSIGDKINADLHAIKSAVQKLDEVMSKPKPKGLCIFCSKETDKTVGWISNDKNIDGTKDFVCDNCRLNEL